MDSWRKKPCMQKDGKSERTLWHLSIQGESEDLTQGSDDVQLGRGRRRKGGRVHVHCCLDLCISDCPDGPSWSSDSLGFCVFPYPSLLPFPCGNPDRGPMPFLRVFASSEGKVKVLSCRASLQVRRQLAWELLGDRETLEPTLKPGLLAKPLSEFVSSSPPVLNSAESPWSSICLHVS